jgi:outer membrane biosynthesis protein TonB
MTRQWTTLGMVIGLLISASPGLGQQSADPRLSDPAFAQVREEALSSTKCSGRTNPIAVSTPHPKYPKALSRDHVKGMAITEGFILHDGKLKYTRVLKADRPEFGQASLDAIKKYRFKPALCGGKPVAAYIAFTHTFSLQ